MDSNHLEMNSVYGDGLWIDFGYLEMDTRYLEMDSVYLEMDSWYL